MDADSSHCSQPYVEGVTHAHWLLDFTPLVLLAAAPVAAYYQAQPGDGRMQNDYGTH